MKVGDHVTYVDPVGAERPALVTAVWGYAADPEYVPGVNVVLVSNDAAQTDSYGRQITRSTSLVHKPKQVAPGNYWKLPSE